MFIYYGKVLININKNVFLYLCSALFPSIINNYCVLTYYTLDNFHKK